MPGICISIKKCPYLWKLISNKQNKLSTKERELLEKSKCGEDNDYPKVCCLTCGKSASDDADRIAGGGPAELGIISSSYQVKGNSFLNVCNEDLIIVQGIGHGW